METRYRIASSLSKPEERLLRHYGHNLAVVEAGSLLGYSTLVLASVAKSVISIDRHQGYGAPTERAFRSNLAVHGAKNVRPIIGEATQVIDTIVGCKLAFIDLDGTEETTRTMLQKVRTTLVALHDVGRQSCRGVERAMQNSAWRVVEGAGTLVVMERALG